MPRTPRYPWSEGGGRNTVLWLRSDNEQTMMEAKEFAKDLGMPLSVLIANALEDYMTLHQHITVNETRARTTAEDYSRSLRTNGY